LVAGEAEGEGCAAGEAVEDDEEFDGVGGLL
jgi:hypothetical protein